MTGKRIGLVIGNNYKNSEKELKFAVADALDIKAVLEHKDICGFDDVVILSNKSSKEASIELERLLKNAGQGDLIFIYFSGHGKKDFTNGLYFLFEDTDEETPLATSLTFDFINKCRKYPQAKQASVVVVLDCCYSGSAELRDTNVEEAIASYSGQGTVILTSTGSTGSPTAKEDKDLGHGIFTHYLVEGLKEGHADRTGEGYIYVDDLYQYAYKMTTKRCTQSPKKAGSIEGSIFIGRNPQKIRENEYNSKKSKLLCEYVKKLPPRILDESQTILRIAYDVPPSLDSVEETIYDLLNSLLKGELQPENYSDAVQHLKGISISSENSPNNNKVGHSNPVVSKGENRDPKGNSGGSTNPPKTFTSSLTGMEFVLIPDGMFMMGSPSEKEGRYDDDESPAHKVKIEKPFYMGKYPVTQKQWKEIMGSNPSRFKGDGWPVEMVSWNDVQEFIKILNEKEDNIYCLPSEAEWEYACRAGTTTIYSFGDDESKLGDYGWYGDNSGSKTHPVGQKKSNPWDLHDMHGNVWEWVQDSYHSSYNGAPSDGSAWEDGNSSRRVFRGGCFGNYADGCLSAYRRSYVPGYRSDGLGFRLLRKL